MDGADREGLVVENPDGNGVIVRAMGADFGNLTTKQVIGRLASPKQRVTVNTLILPGEHLPSDGADLAKRPMMQALDVTITSPAVSLAETEGAELRERSGQWLVGDCLAQSASLAQRAMTTNRMVGKHLNEPLYVTGLTGLACLAVKNLPAREDLFTVETMVCSLPVRDFSDSARKEVRRRLKGGNHTVKFNRVPTIADGRTVKIRINRVEVIPEGLGAALAQIYGWGADGKLKLVRPELLRETIGIVDIGGGTSEFVTIKPGLKYEPDPAATLGRKYGALEFLETVVKRVTADTKDDTVLANVGELVNHLTGWDGRTELSLPNRGQKPVPLNPYLDDEFSKLAQNVAYDIEQFWSAKISTVFVVGGGSLAIRPYLDRYLKSSLKPTFVTGDPIMANALGNLIFAQRLAGDA